MKTKLLTLMAASFVVAVLPASAARLEVGTLTCDLSSGVGQILLAKQDVDCFLKSQGGIKEHYRGTIVKYGLEIGQLSDASLVWLVYSATQLAAGALGGDYVGVSADASLGQGLGANVLGGGQGKSIALQPLSLQSETGVNIAVGTEQLNLRLAR